jgi:rubrerythrin
MSNETLRSQLLGIAEIEKKARKLYGSIFENIEDATVKAAIQAIIEDWEKNVRLAERALALIAPGKERKAGFARFDKLVLHAFRKDKKG